MDVQVLDPFMVGLYVFCLAVFVGIEIVSKVPPILHTPMMSAINAVSGITLLGALWSIRSGSFSMGNILGFLAITLATINVIGGYLVTDRMLRMFKRKK